MKKAFSLALIAVLLTSATCFGEILNTAVPLGQDKLAIQGFYTSSSFADNNASQFGPKIIYGITPDFDVIGKLGMGSYAGVSASTLGIGCKYAFLKIKKGDSVDLSGYVNYETYSITSVSLYQLGFGAIISKEVRKNITLYGVLGITQLSYDYKDLGVKVSYSASALTFGGGARFEINKDLALLAEITTYSADGSSFSTVGLGGQYLL